MCFSATASFASGVILIAAGTSTIKQTKTKNALPFASIPLIFGIQQIIEGFVWISFGYGFIHTIATYAFAFFAFVFWPIYVPATIRLIETNERRRKILKYISAIGAVLGIYLFTRLIIGPVVSSIQHNSICYDVPVPFPLTSFFLYLLAACGSSLVSSSRIINIFGTTTLVGFFIAHTYYPQTSFSVWCFFSAVLSVIIYSHLKEYQTHSKSEDLILG